MKKFLKNEKGFTLVEVIIVILITGILSTSLVNLVAVGKNMYSNNKGIDEIEKDARIAMAAIVSRVRKNDRIHDDGSHYVQIVDNSDNVLSAFGNESSILRVENIAGDFTWLTLEEGQVVEKTGSHTKDLTKTGLIKSLEFTNISDADNFSIKIEIKYDQYGKEKNIETDIVLRSGN